MNLAWRQRNRTQTHTQFVGVLFVVIVVMTSLLGFDLFFVLVTRAQSHNGLEIKRKVRTTRTQYTKHRNTNNMLSTFGGRQRGRWLLFYVYWRQTAKMYTPLAGIFLYASSSEFYGLRPSIRQCTLVWRCDTFVFGGTYICRVVGWSTMIEFAWRHAWRKMRAKGMFFWLYGSTVRVYR